MSLRRAIIIVLDGVGIGEAPDAAAYGDVGSHTLGNLARRVGGLQVPNLQAAGLGNIAPLTGVAPASQPTAATGQMRPISAGKDSTSGHWEIAGVVLERPFPTYPAGFPTAVIEEFSRRTGRPVIGNVVGSGTAIIDEYADEQRRTGAWIVYTSADSVFQIAAHEEWIPLAELYAACETARAQLVAPHNLSRVIARPFVGANGVWTRTANRRDYSVVPPSDTLLDILAATGIRRHGVGKVDDLFAGRAIQSEHTSGNAEGVAKILHWLRGSGSGFLFANLVDFDQLYGHRNDVEGFHGALRAFDAALPELLAALRDEDLLFLTADHGNDPTTASTDHARECVPLLAFGRAVLPTSLGTRGTFADLGATVAAWLGVPFPPPGRSFLRDLVRA
jgi:phosphopentomutase